MIFGTEFDTLPGDEALGYIENIYCLDSMYVDIYLIDETTADITFGHEYDPDSEDFVFLLPDGSTLTLDAPIFNEDGTLTFLGETLEMLDYDLYL